MFSKRSDESWAVWALVVSLAFALGLLLGSSAHHRVFEGLGVSFIAASALLAEPRLLMWSIAWLFDDAGRRRLAANRAHKIYKIAGSLALFIAVQVLLTGGLLALTFWAVQGRITEARFLIAITLAVVVMLFEISLVTRLAKDIVPEIAIGLAWVLSGNRRFVAAGMIFLIGVALEFIPLFGK